MKMFNRWMYSLTIVIAALFAVPTYACGLSDGVMSTAAGVGTGFVTIDAAFSGAVGKVTDNQSVDRGSGPNTLTSVDTNSIDNCQTCHNAEIPEHPETSIYKHDYRVAGADRQTRYRCSFSNKVSSKLKAPANVRGFFIYE